MRHYSKARFCAENCRFRGSLRCSAESAKKGVDEENGGPYKPPLPARGSDAPDRVRASAQLFDIAGIRKRNAGGMNCLRSLRLHDDHDECVSRKYLFIMWTGFGRFVCDEGFPSKRKLQSAIPVRFSPDRFSSDIEHST